MVSTLDTSVLMQHKVHINKKWYFDSIIYTCFKLHSLQNLCSLGMFNDLPCSISRLWTDTRKDVKVERNAPEDTSEN